MLTNSWKLKNTLLNDERVIREIIKKKFKFLGSNENEYATYQGP